MAGGIPVIASKAGDIPAIVKDGVNGFLVEEKSPFQIAQKIITLINNSELMRDFGTSGVLMLNENFTIEKMIDKIEKIYEKIL
jgi:spore coat protein SA